MNNDTSSRTVQQRLVGDLGRVIAAAINLDKLGLAHDASALAAAAESTAGNLIAYRNLDADLRRLAGTHQLVAASLQLVPTGNDRLRVIAEAVVDGACSGDLAEPMQLLESQRATFKRMGTRGFVTAQALSRAIDIVDAACIAALVDERTGGRSLSEVDWNVLGALAQRGTLTAAETATAVDATTPKLRSSLRRLTAIGLVEREPSVKATRARYSLSGLGRRADLHHRYAGLG